MRNHFHLVIRQGYEPLETLMSSFMRRIALRVKRDNRHEGHVFEKRFWVRACPTVGYLRNAIVYTHRNPVKARLCTELSDYKWSSHAAYLGLRNASWISGKGLELFAENPGQDHETTRLHYVRYAEWRARVLQLRKESPLAALPPRPCTLAGDATWKKSFTALPPKEDFHRPDLRDIVLKVVGEAAPGLPIDFVQSQCRAQPIVELRKEIVRRGLEHGYAGCDIARWLKISPQSVSRIKTGLLYARYSPPLEAIAEEVVTG